MATPRLPLGHMEAGRAYLEALEKLGLRPLGLFWAYDHVVGHFVLVMIAEEYEQVGPPELFKKLFKAYNAQATPRAINPFVVRLHSPRQPIALELGESLLSRGEFKPKTPAPDDHDEPEIDATVTAGGLEFKHQWVFHFDTSTSHVNSIEAQRRWRRFSSNVDRLAA